MFRFAEIATHFPTNRLGPLPVMVFAFILSWISFFCLNLYFDSTVFGRYRTFSELEDKTSKLIVDYAFAGLSTEAVESLGNQLKVELVQSQRFTPSDNSLKSKINATKGGDRLRIIFTSPGEETDKFEFGLTIEPITGGDFLLMATYGVLNRSADSAGAALTDFHPDARLVVLEQDFWPWLGLKTSRLKTTCTSLADRFIERMKIDANAAGKSNQAIADRDRQRRVRKYVERVLLTYLGRIEYPDLYESSPESGETGVLDWARVTVTNMEQLTEWPRRLNGSDRFGVIQWLTVYCFWALAVLLIVRQWQVKQQAQLLKNPAFMPERTPQKSLRNYLNEQLQFVEGLFEDKRRRLSHIPADIAYYGCSALKSANLNFSAVPAFVDARIGYFSDKAATDSAMVRYLLWLIPSIGFVGTVVGIGNALLGTGDVLADDPLAQQTAIQDIAGKLGTAFDTTFVALVLAIVGMWLFHLVQKKEETVIQQSAEKTLSALIDPDQVPSQNTVSAAAKRGEPFSNPIMENHDQVSYPRITAGVRTRFWLHLLAVLIAGFFGFAIWLAIGHYFGGRFANSLWAALLQLF